jgi:hypothetical protein
MLAVEKLLLDIIFYAIIKTVVSPALRVYSASPHRGLMSHSITT